MKNNELKKVSIKKRMYYYFDDINKFEDFGFVNILLDEKPYENILVYDISYKTLIGDLHINFNKIDGFIRVYNGTGYLVLFDPGKYNAIFDRIRFHTRLKSGISYVISQNFARIKVDSYDSLPMEKHLLCIML